MEEEREKGSGGGGGGEGEGGGGSILQATYVTLFEGCTHFAGFLFLSTKKKCTYLKTYCKTNLFLNRSRICIIIYFCMN